MVVASKTDDVREAIRLIVTDPNVNSAVRPSLFSDRPLPGQPQRPAPRPDDGWDRYAYIFYIGEGVTSATGFRYTAGKAKPRGIIADATEQQLRTVFARIRDAGDPPVEKKWNAAVITYERATQDGDLHLFYGLEAEDWNVTIANQDQAMARALALFDHRG